jgi:hypothetical protein
MLMVTRWPASAPSKALQQVAADILADPPDPIGDLDRLARVGRVLG